MVRCASTSIEHIHYVRYKNIETWYALNYVRSNKLEHP